ncbi:hypothetical protein BRDCF_p1966 [Bacteroidales bacterium CF]|jgi:hypothetical protein|nr:hypothetical protein BRDCF_p1966 [Bacteroidales bacterium CF]HNX56705.1 hypothetical protein [Prolixibacteraceae bacterium]
MDTKKIVSFIVLLGGEAIIIAAFILFRGSLAPDVLVLNIVVSSVIYGLFFLDILVPWINLNDKQGKKVGSLGVRWLFTWLYAIAAIAVMLVGNLACEWSFALQIIIHCVLLFFLILGLVASLHSGDKVQEVYQQETFNRNGINEMKTAIRDLKDKMNDLPNLPEYFIRKINTLEDSLRFISPTENAEAHGLEQQFIRVINDIAFAISNYSMNEEAIGSNLKKAERIYQIRKSIYSN